MNTYLEMEKITIYYGTQGNGMAFRMAVGDYKAIKVQFPDAQPAKGVSNHRTLIKVLQ